MISARDFFVYTTGIFWIGIGYFAVRCPHDQAPAPVSILELPKASAGKKIPLAEVARHDKPGDCWMVIEGKVYEVHNFIDLHPSAAGVMEPYCGKEATQPYVVIDSGKLKGQPHSARANELLAEYLVGELARD